MNMTRSWLVWGALIATLFFTWRINVDDVQTTVMPTRVLADTTLKSEPFTTVDHAKKSDLSKKLELRKPYENRVDLFALPQDELEERGINRQKVKPQPILLSPLPFKFVGRWKDQTQMLVLFSMNDEIVSAKEGDTIFKQYQVLSISEQPQGLSISFLNKLFHQTQILQVGKSQDE